MMVVRVGEAGLWLSLHAHEVMFCFRALCHSVTDWNVYTRVLTSEESSASHLFINEIFRTPHEPIFINISYFIISSCLWPQSILRGGVIIHISFNTKLTKIKLMSHSTIFLTCNCRIAAVLFCGAIYGRRDEAGTQNWLITGHTGEGLNYGRGHNKWLKTVKQNALKSEYQYVLFTEDKERLHEWPQISDSIEFHCYQRSSCDNHKVYMFVSWPLKVAADIDISNPVYDSRLVQLFMICIQL